MSGKNDYPLVINARDISEITNKITEIRTSKLTNRFDYSDLTTAQVILALEQFLNERNTPTGFKLELYDDN